MVIGTLAVDGWAVTFGTARRGPPINNQCTNYISFDVALFTTVIWCYQRVSLLLWYNRYKVVNCQT